MKALSFSKFINEQKHVGYEGERGDVPSHEELSDLFWFRKIKQMYENNKVHHHPTKWVTGDIAYKKGTRVLAVSRKESMTPTEKYALYPFKGTIIREGGKPYKGGLNFQTIEDWNLALKAIYMRELHYLIHTMSIGNTEKLINAKDIKKIIDLTGREKMNNYPGLVPSVVDAMGLEVDPVDLTVMLDLGLEDIIGKI